MGRETNKMDGEQLGLRETVMLNQFINVTGCSQDQAKQLLLAGQWNFEVALSIYFQEVAVTAGGVPQKNNAPTNTPATPPMFPDTLLSLAKLQTNDANCNQINPSLNPPPSAMKDQTYVPHLIKRQ